MTYFLILSILVMPILGCRTRGDYQSMAEAEAACLQWSEEGGTYDKHERDEAIYNSYLTIPLFEIDQIYLEEPIPPPEMYKHHKDIPIRTCRIEEETNQFLGYEKPLRKNAVIICRDSIYDPFDYFDPKCELTDYEVKNIKAHFRY